MRSRLTDEERAQAAAVAVPVQGSDDQVESCWPVSRIAVGGRAGGQARGVARARCGGQPDRRFVPSEPARICSRPRPSPDNPAGRYALRRGWMYSLSLTRSPNSPMPADAQPTARGAIRRGGASRLLLPVLTGGALETADCQEGHGVRVVRGVGRSVDPLTRISCRPERPAHRRLVDGDADDRRWTADAGRMRSVLGRQAGDYNGTATRSDTTIPGAAVLAVVGTSCPNPRS